LSLLTGLSPANYQAKTLVEIMWLPTEKLKILMKQEPELAFILAKLLAK